MTDHTIYHFTPAANLPGIVAAGGIYPDNVMSSQPGSFVECASAEIKGARRTKQVPVSPFGYVGDYVPFYYATRSPTMCAITNGQVPGYRETKQLIYLASSVAAVNAAGLQWVCTDGNARTGSTLFYNTWEDLEARTDWQIMKDRYWRNTDDDGDRKRRRMAEFLVRDFFPFSLVTGIATYSEEVLHSIQSFIPQGVFTAVKPEFYI